EAELGDAAEAAEAWRLFQEQFPKAAAKEVYMTTPCREADIKFRFRRMKEAME
ncbi:unnamed protein product, partial [Symbiodinium sp. KB8]